MKGYRGQATVGEKARTVPSHYYRHKPVWLNTFFWEHRVASRWWDCDLPDDACRMHDDGESSHREQALAESQQIP
jgi:hypothetical protein